MIDTLDENACIMIEDDIKMGPFFFHELCRDDIKELTDEYIVAKDNFVAKLAEIINDRD